jgi:8-oxo-dGTP diphosphatase
VSGGRAKTVHYWVGHVVGDDNVSSYEINEEVDDLAWLSKAAAKERMTYLDDIDLLAQLDQGRKTTSSLVIVRHAKAEKRDSWNGPDPARPLNELGQVQADAIVPLLHAFGVARVITSPSTRCVQTVQPYAAEQVLPMTELEELSEEGFDEVAAGRLLSELLATPEPSVVCSHRPALPRLLELLGVEEEPLAPGELVVCHHRKGAVVATERHTPSRRGI